MIGRVSIRPRTDSRDENKQEWLREQARKLGINIEFPPANESEEAKEEWLRARAEELEVDLPKEYVNPVDKILELEDDPTTCYFWKVKEGFKTVEQRELLAQIYSRFVKQNHRDPRALHVVAHSIEDIKEYAPDELKNLVIPWIEGNLKQS